MLAGLIVAAFALVGAIVGLTEVVLNSLGGASAAASPLIVPAPGVAGGLPILTAPVTSDTTQELLDSFKARFVAATGAPTGQPSAVYREPGTLDLATDKPAWVMYVGYNSNASLGAPQATVLKLMAGLTGTSQPSSWSISAGDRGGKARCAIAKITDISVSICAWATSNTYGALMSPAADTSADELAVLMPEMRLDLQPG